jgi:hypothetical protein
VNGWVQTRVGRSHWRDSASKVTESPEPVLICGSDQCENSVAVTFREWLDWGRSRQWQFLPRLISMAMTGEALHAMPSRKLVRRLRHSCVVMPRKSSSRPAERKPTTTPSKERSSRPETAGLHFTSSQVASNTRLCCSPVVFCSHWALK